MNKKKRDRIQKGEFGYFRREKKRRFFITAILLGVPLFIFVSMWIYLGTRNSIWTVIAIVGCLPGCRSVVSLIMILLRKPMDEELYRQIREHQGGLTMAYEMYMTFYEKSAYIHALAVCGNTVVGYSGDPGIDGAFMAEQAQRLVRKNGYKVDVKILTELRPFLERLDSMNQHQDSLREGIRFTPDERYPDYTREDMIRHVLLNLCI
ncbi:MAG: hypothetical protein Q4D55_03855 [Eubacteriales bacterium]|nr:hypothetical protein [Eubacteriales bacterium]